MRLPPDLRHPTLGLHSLIEFIRYFCLLKQLCLTRSRLSSNHKLWLFAFHDRSSELPFVRLQGTNSIQLFVGPYWGETARRSDHFRVRSTVEVHLSIFSASRPQVHAAEFTWTLDERMGASCTLNILSMQLNLPGPWMSALVLFAL